MNADLFNLVLLSAVIFAVFIYAFLSCSTPRSPLRAKINNTDDDDDTDVELLLKRLNKIKEETVDDDKQRLDDDTTGKAKHD